MKDDFTPVSQRLLSLIENQNTTKKFSKSEEKVPKASKSVVCNKFGHLRTYFYENLITL